eukprot:s759_g3.t1
MATMTQTVGVETESWDNGSSFGSSATSSSAIEKKPLSDQERMPPTASLLLIHYFLVLATVNLVITIPTANEYAERLGAGRLFAGLMIGCLPILGIAGNLVNQKLFSCLPFKTIWILNSLGTVLGSVLYALAGLMRFKWTLLIARGLMGFCSAFSLPGIYVSHTVGLKRRSEILFYFSAVLTLGCAVGPALAAMLEASMKFIRIENLVLDSDTIPGWFMAVLYLLFTAKLILLLKDLPTDALAEVEGRTLESLGRRSGLPLTKVAACCACFWSLFVSSAVTTGVEVYSINVCTHYMSWSIAKSACFVAALMFVSGIFNLTLGKLLRCLALSDVKGLMGATVFACVSCGFLVNFELEHPTVKISLLSIGLVLVLISMGLVRAFGLSLCSKMVPPETLNSVMTWATVGMSLGRGGGSIVCSVLSPDSFAPVLLGLFTVVWFDVRFGASESGTVLSTSPGMPDTHWKQTVLYLTEPLVVFENDVIVGRIGVRKNVSNPRDLDVKLAYQLQGVRPQEERTQGFRIR